MVTPIVSSCLLSVGISCVSNVVAQRLRAWHLGQPFVFDRLLFLNCLIIAIITTPPNFYWQAWLERTFPGWKLVPRDNKDGGTDIEMGVGRKSKELDGAGAGSGGEDMVRVRSWPNTWKKWFADCMTVGALGNTAAFLFLMGLLKGKTWPEIGMDLRTETFPIIFDSYKIWPIANFVSMTWVPVAKRIVFFSAFGLVWSIYLTLVAARL